MASELKIKPDYIQKSIPFKHTWAGFGNIDQMRWMARKDCLDQLKEGHKNLGIRHIRAVGMFDDDLYVIGRDPKNFNAQNTATRYNWQYIDYIFDELLDIGIAPMFTTTFTPRSLASGDQSVFDTQLNVTLPKSFKEWEDLILATLNHMLQRYGKERMKDWYYEVWNEPNLNAFFAGSMEDFFQLWQSTWNVIKKIDADFKIGGPSTARAEWIPEFLDFAEKNNCMPDYLIGHIYNNDSENAALSPFSGPQDDKINKSPNFIGGVIRGVKEIAKERNFKGEIHWNEWGRSWFPYDPQRETANEAAFIVKTMAEVSHHADYFAYWCFSDIYNQLGYGAETFHGNYGMTNLQGLKKPSYFAHQLLSKLGAYRLTVSNQDSKLENAIVTNDDGQLSILIYSFDPDFEPGNQSQILKVEVSLPENWNESNYNIELYRVSQENNNIVTTWQKNGSPDYINYEERKLWKERNVLEGDTKNYQVRKHENENILEFEMLKPGIVLAQITPGNQL